MNPAAIVLVALAAVVGAVFFDSWLLGLLVGLAVVALAIFLPLIRP